MFKGFVYLGFFFFCVGGSPVFATTEDSDSWLAQNAEVELGGRPDAVQHSAAMQQKADYLPSAATVGTDVGANGESPQDATTAVQDPTPVTVDPSSAGVFSVQPVDPGLSYGGSTGFGGNQALLAGGKIGSTV